MPLQALKISKLFLAKGDPSITTPTPEPSYTYNITVGSTGTQVGYWKSKALGSSNTQDISRLSVTVSTSKLFLEQVDTTQPKVIVDVEGFGELELTLSSGRYVKSLVSTFKDFLLSKHNQKVNFNIK